MPKLTEEAFQALMRKPGTYHAHHRTAEDWLQYVAFALRQFEADDATAEDTMWSIASDMLSWV